MVYRKQFSIFLRKSFLSDHEASLYLGCSYSALSLWKTNENTAPKEAVHHLEEYVEKLNPFYDELKNIFEWEKSNYNNIKKFNKEVDNIIHNMKKSGIYGSTIMNMLSYGFSNTKKSCQKSSNKANQLDQLMPA